MSALTQKWAEGELMKMAMKTKQLLDEGFFDMPKPPDYVEQLELPFPEPKNE